jgi:MFS family permease
MCAGMKQPSKLMNKNFFLLWQGQLVSQIGSHAFIVAIMFWTKHVTGSATLMGMLVMVAMLPGVILGPVGGTVADRFSRRAIIILSDVLNGIVVLLFSLLIFLYPQEVNLNIIFLFFVTIFIGIVGSFFRPAISASIPDLVPENKLATANSLNQSSFQISMFIGQGLGGILYRVLGPLMLIFVDGLSYLFSAISESFIAIPQKIPERSKDYKSVFQEFKSDTIGGFRYIWKRVGMRNLFVAAAFTNFFAMPIILLLPFYVEDFLKVTTEWYGYLIAAWGFGSLLGFFLIGMIRLSGRTRCLVIIPLAIVASLIIGSLGFIEIPIIALILMVAGGTLNGIFNITIITLLQKTTPSEIRGRVFGLLGTISSALAPIAMGLAGAVADLVNKNIPLIYISCGAILVVIDIIISLNKEYRHFLSYESKEFDTN